MNLLSDKSKEQIDKELMPVSFSFVNDTFDEEGNSIIFYVNFAVDGNPKKSKSFLDVLEFCKDTESIIFNYSLTKEQVLGLLSLIHYFASSRGKEDKVSKGLYKLLAVMCKEYNYNNFDFDGFIGEKFEIDNENTFNDIIESIESYEACLDDILNDKKNTNTKYYYEYDLENDDRDYDLEYELEDCDLERYTTNLTNFDYKFDPAIGRDDEIKNTLVALMQNSCVLVGESGVGKTAIAQGIAYRIKNGLVPDSLKDKQLYSLSASDIVSGCRYVGDMEEKLTSILAEVIYRENVILFFDEIHTAIGTGKGSEGSLDIANILKPYIDRGQIKMIGATTVSEYDEYISRDPAFRRRFDKIAVKEPNQNSLSSIIDHTITNLEKETNIKFNTKKLNKDELIKQLIEITGKSHRNYVDVEYNPGLVISIIKKAFGFAMYYEHKELEISDIAEAISKCDYLYQPVRTKLNNINNVKTKKKTMNNVIAFPCKK